MSDSGTSSVTEPVDQDRFGSPHGNCTQACIASITGLPLHAIPDFNAWGKVASGVKHMVLWGPDGLVHDPNPSRNGLHGSVEFLMTLRRLGEDHEATPV